MISKVRKELPPGWVEATLGEVLEFKYGRSLPARKRDNIGFPVYGSNGAVGLHSAPFTRVPTLVIGRKGSIGEVHLSHDKCWPIDTTYYVDDFYGQPPEFWLHLLGSLRLADLDRATALPGLNRNDAYKLPLRVPPLNEQKRIVGRIVELRARSRRAREALEVIPDLIEQLRQSVLAAAFHGDLTREWRAKHPKVEPASELLKRIRIERRKRWEEAELEKLKAKGLTGDKLESEFAKRRKQYKEPIPVDTTNLPDLPEGWCWAAVEQIAEWVTDGTHQPPPFTKEGIPFLVIANMVNGKIEWDKIDKWVSLEIYDKYTGIYKPRKGDIIYSTVGSYGVAVEVVAEKRFMFQRHIGHIRPLSERLSVTYLSMALNSPFTKVQADRVARGVAQKTVNLSDLRRFCIPLSPAVEQDEVVKLIGQVFQKTEAQRQFMLSSRQYLDTLDQSILSKAFRGELVPQDPNDEPASILLERIREEKALEAIKRKAKAKRREVKMKPQEMKQKDVVAVLRESTRAITPEEVFAACGFDEQSIDAFYERLRDAVIAKQIRELRKGDSVTLEAVKK